jgi:hypothetical protein
MVSLCAFHTLCGKNRENVGKRKGFMQKILYWLSERLRDAWLWPVNLARDFLARSGRLVHTIAQGGQGVRWMSLFFWRALQNRTFKSDWPPAARQCGIWLHLFAVQLFDLLGGPEICQFVMHLGMHTTPLTGAELAQAQALFGTKNLRYQDVRIAEGGILNLIFRYNGGLAFATWYTVHLPYQQGEAGRTAVSSRQNLPLLIHEMTHIFQYQHVGSRYLGEAIYYLATTQRDCYQYGGQLGLRTSWQQGKQFRQFNREQQAQIVQDYFALTQARQDVSAYQPYVAQLRQAEL